MRFPQLLQYRNQQGISFVVIFLLSITIPVEPTVDIGLQVMQSNGCGVGTVYQPNTCTRCVCGILNLMLCRQVCNPSQDETTNIPPSGNRPFGPTIVPILIPNIYRQPIFQLSPSNLTLLHLLRPIP